MNGIDKKENPERFSAALKLVLQRYGSQIRRRPGLAAASLLLPAIGDILAFYTPPLIVARLLAAFASEQPLTARDLAPYVAAFTSVWLAGEAIWRLAAPAIARIEIRGIESLYVEAMDELLAKDLAFFQNNYAGSLTKRALGYARRFEDVFDVMCFQVFPSLLPIAFVSVVLWKYSALLVLVLVGMMSITCALVVPRIRRRRRLVDIRETASNVLAGHLADSIANAETVRAFAREPEEARIHAGNVADFGEKTLRSWDYQNLHVDMLTSPLYVLTNALGLIVALSASGGTGSSLETVFITFSYYTLVTRVVWQFNRIYRNLEGALTDAAQFAELLLDPPSVTDPHDVERFVPADHGIDIRRINFRHSPAQPLLFEDFSLSVKPGMKVGLVGRSGGGKTTITRLLLRFADLESGAILLGGQRIDRISQADLRAAIGYVPQDPAMFHRSIADNIRIGRPAATQAEVRQAAVLAHAAEFIEALPAGYDTLVGERGVKLSGGQRQRVAIARAILKNAPILILDEATSSLDSESEGLIQEALLSLMADRTAIVIAHRLSTVKSMDELIVLDAGRIVERGTHDTLLTYGGTYALLWAHQSGGFLSTEDSSPPDSDANSKHGGIKPAAAELSQP